jgi:hypothetical protein
MLAGFFSILLLNARLALIHARGVEHFPSS